VCRMKASCVAQSPTQAGLSFIEIGVRIGYVNSGTQTSYQVFTEQKSDCGGYTHNVHGTPAANNYAYYVYYTGYTQYYPCIVPRSEFAVAQGDFYNPPIGYRWLDAASPVWAAKVEIGSRNSPPSYEWTGEARFGNPSGDLSHGLAWYDQPNGTWGTWSSQLGANLRSDFPPVRCSQVNYRAFRTIYSGAC
jgi:hypothetical protein